jgi:gamma-glutamyl-gamma-aminobutyrate hydrolase PuuD
MQVFVVGGDNNYVNFIENVQLVNKLEEAQLVVFTGGEDVTPSLYGCKKHPATYSNPDRDKYEQEIFKRINPNKQVCLGICRGSQFLCVMNGGLLIQNVTTHALYHTHSITNNKRIYEITSTHHQMMYPYNMKSSDYDILFNSYCTGLTEYEGDKIIQKNMNEDKEPEIVLYHKEGNPKCLAVQGHPEMIPDSIVSKMIDNLIQDLVNEIN